MIKIRIKEHEKSCLGDLTDIEPDPTNDNGIPYHHASTGQNCQFDQTKILAIEKNITLLREYIFSATKGLVLTRYWNTKLRLARRHFSTISISLEIAVLRNLYFYNAFSYML